MHIEILTLFPGIVEGPLTESIVKRAQDKNRVMINVRNLRDWTRDRHKTADDRPYGGGAGMVLKPEPIFEAVESICGAEKARWHVVLPSPAGVVFTQQKARELAARPNVLWICGHYEGIDERVRESLVDEEISLGDYVLTNGTLAAAVMIDAVIRLIPGVLGSEESAETESFTDGLLEHPHYTRPEIYRGLPVPETLLSGNHAQIAQWRHEKSLEKTARTRPDLLEKYLKHKKQS